MLRAAAQYLKDVLQKRYDPKKLPPITKWINERDTLQIEKGELNREYYALREHVKEVETIKRNVHSILPSETSQRKRTQDMDL
jgi:hypothetical protein